MNAILENITLFSSQGKQYIQTTKMSQENIVTLVKILESLPDTKQDQVIEHLREYIADIEDKLR